MPQLFLADHFSPISENGVKVHYRCNDIKDKSLSMMTSSHKLDEQSFKKTIHHKTVVFLGHMNDNSNFTFPITSTIPRRWPLQDYTEATVKENPKFHVFGNFGY